MGLRVTWPNLIVSATAGALSIAIILALTNIPPIAISSAIDTADVRSASNVGVTTLNTK